MRNLSKNKTNKNDNNFFNKSNWIDPIFPGGSPFQVTIDSGTCPSGRSLQLFGDSALNLYPMRAEQIEIQVQYDNATIGDIYGDAFEVAFSVEPTSTMGLYACVSHADFLFVSSDYNIPDFVS